MNSKLATLLAVAGMVSVSAAYVPTAAAANINTMATECSAASGSQPTITTAGVLNQTGSPITVLCSLPRSPLAGGVTAGGFFIDGTNPANANTQCSVLSFDFTGTFLGSAGQTATTASNFDLFVSLPSGQLGTFAYTAVSCRLPAGGRLLGITSVQ